MPDPRYLATITVGGRIFSGFTSVMVRREYGDSVSTFQFGASDAGGEAAGLLPGAACVISLAGQTALTGFITTRGCSYDAASHDLVIGGKGITTDPHDSSVPIQPGNFNGYGAEQIIRAGLAPHGVGLNVLNPPPNFAKPFPFFAVNPGETVIQMAQRACAMRGAFLWDDQHGNLCVGQADPAAAPVADLVEGGNILRCVSKIDDQTSVGMWNVYGQQPGVGDDTSIRNAQAQVVNPTARQNRMQVVQAPHPADSQDAASYAGLLAARSGWMTIELEVTVAGWVKPDGSLWQITDNCSVNSPMAIPNGTGRMVLGTQAVVFAQDPQSGTTTTLSLKKPELLTSVGHVAQVSDGSGAFVAAPQPATPVAPDTQGGS